MSDQSLTTTNQPTRQAIEARDRSGRGKVTGRLRRALDAMVWLGARRREAAASAGMTDHSLRSALRKPHVKAAYLAELDVLRTSERARNIHALAEVRDQTANQMARVQAAKALEQIGDDMPAGAGAGSRAGLVIMLVDTAHMSHIRENDRNPLIEHDGGHKDE